MANRPFEGVLKRQWRTFGNETQNAAQTSDKSNSGESSGDSKRTTPQDTKSKSVISKSSDRADLRNMSSYFLSNAERKKNGNVFVPSTVMGKKSGTDNIVRFTPQKKNNIGIGLENPLFPSDLFKNEEIKITSTATKDNKPISDDLDKKLQKLYEEYRAINDAWKNNSMSAYDYNARIAGLKTNNKSVFDAYKKETGGELQIPHLGEMYKNARSAAQQNKKDNEYYRKLKTYYDSYYANDFQKYISDSATSSAENKLDKKLNNIVDASDAYITNIESNSDAPHMYFNSQTNMYEPKVLRNPNSPDMKYLYMTEPERSIYKYQLNKYGEKAADDFLKRMDLILDKRLTEANNKYTEKLTEEHPVLMATGNILTAPVRGAAALADATAQAGKQTFGKEYVPYNPYTNATKLVHQADTVKRTITKDMSPVAKFFTETGMGVGENVSRMAFGNLALPIMGMNVAGETAVDKGVKGETNATKAFATGAAYGGIEMLTEKIPLDNIFKVLKAPPSTIKEAAVTLLKNAGVEASEEAISNIADNVADNIINKDKSEYEQYKQILREQGYSNEEAEKNAFIKFYITDTGISALQGGLSGGILNAGSMATGAAVNNYNDTVQTGRGFRTMGADVVESVINTGKESDNNTPAYKYAQKMQEKQNKGADLSDWNVGRQYQKNVKAVQSENDFAAAMSNIKHTEIVENLYNDKGQELNGAATSESIKVSSDGSQSIPATIKHEWSHMFKILDSEAYQQYENSVIKAARETNSEAVDSRMDFLMNEYGYNEEVAREEIVAELTGGFNTEAIQRMAVGNKTLAAAIADATRTAKAKLRTAFTDGKYTSTTGLQMTFSQLNQAEKMYVYGLNKARNNQVQSEQVRYSPIEYDSDGKAYVKIDEDILEGVPKNEWAKTVRNVLRDKFANGIDYNGEAVAVSRKSRNEFTESKYTKNLFENTKSNKFRMANNLDEIINTQNDIDTENPNHIRKDDIVGFERGNTRVAIGDNEFTAEVLIANKKDGTKQFYDIINLQPTKIQQLSQSGRINDVNTEDADSAVSNNSIPENGGNVKYSVKESSNKNANSMAADIIKSNHSTLKKSDISWEIEEIYSILTNGAVTEEKFQNAWSIAENVGSRVAETSQITDLDTSDEYKRLLSWVRNTPVSINSTDKADISSADSFNEFRKRNFGSIRLTNDGTPIDIVYQELSQQFPQYFDAQNETHPADQLTRIEDVLQDLKPTVRTLSGEEQSAAAGDIAAKLITDIMNGDNIRIKNTDLSVKENTDKVSKLYENTMQKDAFGDEFKSEAERRKPEFMYEGITNKETYAAAQSDIARRGDSEVLSELSMKNSGWTAEDTAKSLALMAQYQSEGNAEKAVDVASMLREKMTRAGQAVQALKIVNKLTPEGQFIDFTRQADKLVDEQIEKHPASEKIRKEIKEAQKRDKIKMGAELHSDNLLTHVTDMAENSKGKSTPKAEPSEWELENSKNTVNASGSTNTVSQGVRKVKMDRKAIRYLKDKDIEEYRLTGNQHTKDKKADIIKKGESIILRSKNETDDFINVSVANENIHQTKAFSKVTDRMVNDVQTVGNIDVSNYYLELNSSDIRHTFEHLNETRKNQIALTEEDIKRIPEYIVNYDDILEVNSKKDGRKIVVLGKKINGHSVIINVASKGRRALTFKSAYVLNTQKYNELYGKSKKDTATRGATATNNVTMPDTSKHAPTAVSSNNSILNYNENVKTEYEKVLDKYGIEYLSPSDMRDTADRLGQLDRLQSKDDLIDLILEQSKERKTASHAIVKKALEGQEITFLKDTAMMQIFGKISDKMPVTFAQKASTYQAMSHLLNARTMARNIVSNTVFNTADMVSTDLGSIADCIMGMFSGQRTVGADRGVFEKGRFRASLDRATKQYIDIALAVDHESGGSKYNLDSARRTFKGRTGGLERAMSYGLQVTDEWSKGGIEHNVRKSLERLKKSGFTEEEINSIAKYEARYRTFQDDTKLSQVLKGLKDTLNVIGIGETKQLGRLKSHEFGLGDLVQKYTQVPGALITRSVEYSPLGYCKALYHIGQAANNARKGADFSAQAQRNIALSLGRAMTGTGLIALFAGLSRLGIFTGEREDEDEKLKAMENAEGVSNTQLNLSALGRLITDGEADGRQNGDVLTSLGFLEPLNTLMAMGNAIAEQGSVKNPVDWAKAAGAKTFDQIMDMSTMSTIRSISNTLQYGGGGTDVAIGVIADSATGFVPSPVRQLGGFLDTVQRNPYNEEDNLARAKERFKATLPWAREDVAAKINPYGEEKTTSSGNRALDFLNNFFSPGSVNIYQTSDISEELYRLAKTSTDVLPHVPAKSFTVDKVKFKPRGKDYEKYSRLVGTITAQKMRDIINGDDYSGMSDEEKIDALSTAATEGEKEAKEQYAAGKADDMPAPHFRMTEPAALKKKQEEINEKNERQEKITGQLQAVSDAAAAAVPDKADNYSLKSLQINSIQSVKIDGKSYDISGEIESKIISAANDEHYSNIEKLMNNEVNVEDIVGYTSKGKVSTAKQADGTKVSLTGKLYNEDGSPRFDELVIAKIISKSKEKSKEHAAEKYRGEITGSSAEGIQVSKSSVNGQGRSTRAKSSSGSKGSGSRARFTSARAAGGDRKSGSTASSGGTSRVVFTARANTGKSNPNYSVVGLPDLIQIPRLPMLDKNYGKLKGSVKTLDNPLFA